MSVPVEYIAADIAAIYSIVQACKLNSTQEKFDRTKQAYVDYMQIESYGLL